MLMVTGLCNAGEPGTFARQGGRAGAGVTISVIFFQISEGAHFGRKGRYNWDVAHVTEQAS